MQGNSTTPTPVRIDQHCHRCGRFLPGAYRWHRWILCPRCDAPAVREAA
jgi:hypothetical protein